LALIFDGTSARTYINGNLTRTIGNLNGAVTTTTGPLRIGSRSQAILNVSPQERFNGGIDEADLFNRALSASEIFAIYNAGNAGKCFSIKPRGAPLAHWKFDETSGNVAHESVGGHDGTLSSTGAAFVAGGISGNAISLNRATNGFVNMGNI